MSAINAETHRTLTDREKLKLANEVPLSEFKQNKLEVEAKKNWDLFYKRNTTKFYKDRHWTIREFEELCGSSEIQDKRTLLEVGCGVGNFIFPLIETDLDFFIYACDFSPRAVEFIKSNPLYNPKCCCAFECDIAQEKSLVTTLVDNTVDVVSLVFVLSSINPNKMPTALRNICDCLKPGSILLFRDYGLYDHAMLRFGPGHKLSDHFYARQDGTRVYYFSVNELEELMTCAGFETICNDYVKRQTVNKKELISVERIFIQGKFRKAC